MSGTGLLREVSHILLAIMTPGYKSSVSLLRTPLIPCQLPKERCNGGVGGASARDARGGTVKFKPGCNLNEVKAL
jgi:hypothetical protein